MNKLLFIIGLCLQFPNAIASVIGPFHIAPYAIKDDHLSIRVKFSLRDDTPLSIVLKEKNAYGQESIQTILAHQIFKREQLQEIFVGGRSCKPEAAVEFISQNIPMAPVLLDQLILPPEICRENGDIYASTRPVLFAHVSDTQTSSKRHQQIADLIKEQSRSLPLEFILNTGDLVDYGNSQNQWLEFFQVASTYLGSIPMVAALGNHDYYGHSEEGKLPDLFHLYMRWSEDKNPGYYAMTYPHFELIVLNSNLHHMQEEQIQTQWKWLEKHLQDNQKNHRASILATHYPLVSSSIWTKVDKSSRLMQKALFPLLKRYKVKLVLSGHTHVYERSLKDGTVHLIAGPAGGYNSISTVKNPYQQFVHGRSTTFSILAVSNYAIEVKTYDKDNQIIDEFVIALENNAQRPPTPTQL